MSKKKIIIILIILNLLTIGAGATLSAYRSSASGTGSFEYAKIVFNNEETDSAYIDLTNMHPGETKDYYFKVGNYQNTKRSEVNIDYKLYVKTYLQISSLSIVIKDSSDNVVVNCNSTTGTRNSNGIFECVSTTKTLLYSGDNEHNYTVEVSLPNGVAAENASLSDYVEIVIDSWQKE